MIITDEARAMAANLANAEWGKADYWFAADFNSGCLQITLARLCQQTLDRAKAEPDRDGADVFPSDAAIEQATKAALKCMSTPDDWSVSRVKAAADVAWAAVILDYARFIEATAKAEPDRDALLADMREIDGIAQGGCWHKESTASRTRSVATIAARWVEETDPLVEALNAVGYGAGAVLVAQLRAELAKRGVQIGGGK